MKLAQILLLIVALCLALNTAVAIQRREITDAMRQRLAEKLAQLKLPADLQTKKGLGPNAFARFRELSANYAKRHPVAPKPLVDDDAIKKPFVSEHTREMMIKHKFLQREPEEEKAPKVTPQQEEIQLQQYGNQFCYALSSSQCSNYPTKCVWSSSKGYCRPL